MDIQPAGFLLGIDGGGTKTEAVIGRSDGTVVGRGMAGGANVHNASFKSIYTNLAAAVTNACEDAARAQVTVDPLMFAGACIGISGIDTKRDQQLMQEVYSQLPAEKRLFHAQQTTICGDGLIGLLSGTSQASGVCLIASTGSNCYGITADGQEAAAGDWGFALGDLGSGYAIGHSMLTQVMKEYDGRAQPSKLTPAVLSHLQLSSVDELVAWVYAQQLPVAEIASLSQILSQPAFATYADMSTFIAKPVSELLSAYRAVAHRLQLESQVFPVVLVGGLFQSLTVFRETVVQLLPGITPAAQIIIPDQSPALGALKLAGMQYGH